MYIMQYVRHVYHAICSSCISCNMFVMYIMQYVRRLYWYLQGSYSPEPQIFLSVRIVVDFVPKLPVSVWLCNVRVWLIFRHRCTAIWESTSVNLSVLHLVNSTFELVCSHHGLSEDNVRKLGLCVNETNCYVSIGWYTE